MKKIRTWISLLLVLAMTLGLGMTAGAASGDRPILALGADFDFCRCRALRAHFRTRSGHCFGLCFLVCGAR